MHISINKTKHEREKRVWLDWTHNATKKGGEWGCGEGSSILLYIKQQHFCMLTCTFSFLICNIRMGFEIKGEISNIIYIYIYAWIL
jgi:hypothetical protein